MKSEGPGIVPSTVKFFPVDMIRLVAGKRAKCGMAKGYLDGKLECASCGTIRMLIPKKADDLTEIHCSSCGRYLGTWGELQDEFAREAGDGTLEFNGGRIRRIESKRSER